MHRWTTGVLLDKVLQKEAVQQGEPWNWKPKTELTCQIKEHQFSYMSRQTPPSIIGMEGLCRLNKTPYVRVLCPK
jgi:hypothetical protein